ncbi:protein arginine N-methyltransferase 7-like isoform X1 [Lytechinus pictus]|uniref:protein arginine N-methyltransferase 7-like isoform X1 n=2 Tax=Lytechinus pictus TaxID=7653 RepID=UPI0030B9E1B9
MIQRQRKNRCLEALALMWMVIRRFSILIQTGLYGTRHTLFTFQRPQLSRNYTTCRMSQAPLSSQVNPTTGALEWVVEDESYDYHQEIARSAYTDMLHDDERNKKYYEGIRRAISIIRGRGQKVRVLDIGTGTGLLAMMAANCGADSVYACEAFPPIAEAAKKIIDVNGFADKITVISKRSTEVTVGPDGDMPVRANILATEVFDTELIGEGAVPTYLHAHKCLLTDDCICVPHKAVVKALLVQSDFIWRWHKLQPIQISGCEGIVPHPDMTSCSGAASVHDIQLSQVSPDQFQPITEPLSVIDFNFTQGDFTGSRTRTVSCESLISGKCQGVFMWWDLTMDTEGEVLLSTAPTWCHQDGSEAQWRDHWMQAVYFLDQPVHVNKGDTVSLTITHDDYSQWFDVRSGEEKPSSHQTRPICRCGAHVVWSRPRFGMLNDQHRTNKFVTAMRKIITNDSVCLSISDGSMLPLLAARLGAKQVYSIESSSLCRRVMDKVIEVNSLMSKVKLLDQRAQDLSTSDLDCNKVSVLLAEPFFLTSLLPWHNLYLWYAWSALRPLLAPDVKLLPSRGKLMGIAIQFDDLWKFHAPVRTLEGFDVRIFDNIVQKSSECTDAPTEPHHLWEYPGRSLTQQFELMTFDFSKPIPEGKSVRNGVVDFCRDGTCHGIALWMEYGLDDTTTISTGLQETVEGSGETSSRLVWDMHSKQGVHFLKANPEVKEDESLNFEVTFNTLSGNLHFNFEVNQRER